VHSLKRTLHASVHVVDFALWHEVASGRLQFDLSQDVAVEQNVAGRHNGRTNCQFAVERCGPFGPVGDFRALLVGGPARNDCGDVFDVARDWHIGGVWNDIPVVLYSVAK
jgi:hypothetical protein